MMPLSCWEDTKGMGTAEGYVPAPRDQVPRKLVPQVQSH